VLDADNIEITGKTSVKVSGGGSTVDLGASGAKVAGKQVEITGSSVVKINS